MSRVDIDVEGDAVEGRAARNLQADRADLTVAPSLFGQPHARTPFDAVHRQFPDLTDGVDDRGLDGANPLHEIDGLTQAHDGVDDDLSGTMPRRGARAVGADDGDRRGGNVLGLRVAPGRPGWRELGKLLTLDLSNYEKQGIPLPTKVNFQVEVGVHSYGGLFLWEQSRTMVLPERISNEDTKSLGQDHWCVQLL